jgi:transcriptional regulator with XRE-family HTH domain/tetratricopeptide (TPR) repeat protein
VTFGDDVRRRRRRQGLSQEDLAERIGMSVTGIRNLESGRTRAPRPSTVRLLAEAFGLTGDEREDFLATAAPDAAHGDGWSRRTEPRRIEPRRTEPTWPVPAQLPPDVPGFTGRDPELARLDALVAADCPGGLVAVTGTAGVGKTTLAVHWAHRVRERFPDGQLHADLSGFGPDEATPPRDVARRFLEALGVPGHRIPAELDGRTGLFRSLLADRRMLVVLDDARDADQVRPLLPGAPGCLVIVTSRTRLTGLVITAATVPLSLGVLPADDARALLVARLGRRRVAADPEAADEIVARCAGLPLALSVVAARAALDPQRPLGDVRDDLRAAGAGLEPFDETDAAVDLRSVLSWSYRALDAEAARLFRLLALHPGPDVALPAAASLAGVAPATARRLLDTLTAAHLLDQAGPGRHTAHDLLRAYAAELLRDGDDDTRVATARLLDHYLHVATAAAELLTPGRPALPLPVPITGAVVAGPSTREAALAWFAAEEAALPAAVSAAAVAGFDVHAWQLAEAAGNYLQRCGRWTTLLGTGQVALNAARRAGDVAGQVHAHRGLARACGWLGQAEAAREHAIAAERLCRETDDVPLQAHSHLDLALVLERQDAIADAARHARQAHALFGVARDRPAQIRALNMVAWCLARLGELGPAVAAGREVVAYYEKVDDVAAEANAWDTVGYAEHGLGNRERAAECYRHSRTLFTAARDRYGEAMALTHLGDVLAEIGDAPQARCAWDDAVLILDALGHADAAGVRARLAKVR